MEISHINTHCPELGERVVVTVARPDRTPGLTIPPLRLTNCDFAAECGLIKEEGITPDWSLCPLYDLKFLN